MEYCTYIRITKLYQVSYVYLRISTMCCYIYILYKIRDADFECNIRSITFIVLTNLPLQISMTLSHYVLQNFVRYLHNDVHITHNLYNL